MAARQCGWIAGRLEEAVNELDEAIASFPNYSESHRFFAAALAHLDCHGVESKRHLALPFQKGMYLAFQYSIVHPAKNQIKPAIYKGSVKFLNFIISHLVDKQ